jgi:hypothetical protein
MKEAVLITVYGGVVDRDELLPGQMVWLKGCGRGRRVAAGLVAVLQLASTNPGDDFPK